MKKKNWHAPLLFLIVFSYRNFGEISQTISKICRIYTLKKNLQKFPNIFVENRAFCHGEKHWGGGFFFVFWCWLATYI
jgi:hypothetical protein